ncbi:MAG: ATP-binding cassette domain-containing protein [Spirochaetota bacterium]
MLEIRELSYERSGTPVLDKISLRAAPGDIIAVLGKSGSGKSALLSAVAGKLPVQGDILFNGSPAGKGRSSCGSILLFPGKDELSDGVSVCEAVLSGRAPHKKKIEPYSPFDIQTAEEKIREFALDAVRDTELASLPDALFKMTLLAHYAAYDAELFLLDNPEEALDISLRRNISRALRKYVFSGERTVIFASNDLTFAAQCADRFVIMEQGKISAEGGYDILTEDLIRKVYGCESIVSKNIYNGRPEIQFAPES